MVVRNETLLGEEWQVAATPNTGVQDVKTVLSAPLTIPTSPPVIVTSPPLSVPVNGLYLYDLNATDPDGDPLNYSLPVAPQNLSIGQAGLITWLPNVEPQPQGPFGGLFQRLRAWIFRAPVKVIAQVSDSNDGSATQSWNITVGAVLGK